MRTSGERLTSAIEPMPNHLDVAFADWIRNQAEAEPYWFQKIELFPGTSRPAGATRSSGSSRTSGCRRT